MLSWSRSRRPSQRRWSSPDSFGVGDSARARNVAEWRRSISSRSPLSVEPLGGELADRVEHPEARLAVDLLGPDEALVGEGHQAVEDVEPSSSAAGPQTASALSSSQPPTNTRQPGEQAPLACVEQVVAPGDRAAERLLALRQVARPGRRGRRAGARGARGSRPARAA